jgi:tRNA 2-thiouridine synthesizing protein A
MPQPTPVDAEVDATGLACPLPVIELAKAVDAAAAGAVVRLVATDAAARVDVPVWCRMQGHRLASQEEVEPGVLHFLVAKRA